jgi:hypothetical protein
VLSAALAFFFYVGRRRRRLGRSRPCHRTTPGPSGGQAPRSSTPSPETLTRQRHDKLVSRLLTVKPVHVTPASYINFGKPRWRITGVEGRRFESCRARHRNSCKNGTFFFACTFQITGFSKLDRNLTAIIIRFVPQTAEKRTIKRSSASQRTSRSEAKSARECSTSK